MTETVTLTVDGKQYTLPLLRGTEGEVAIDISTLRATTGIITLDSGYGNTGSCRSAITFIDGEKGILRYRGVPIEDLASRSSFIEAAELLIFGELPDADEREEFRQLLTENSALHRDMRKHFDGFPVNAHPMAILSAMINAIQAYDLPGIHITEEADFRRAAANLLAKTRTIAAAACALRHCCNQTQQRLCTSCLRKATGQARGRSLAAHYWIRSITIKISQLYQRILT